MLTAREREIACAGAVVLWCCGACLYLPASNRLTPHRDKYSRASIAIFNGAVACLASITVQFTCIPIVFNLMFKIWKRIGCSIGIENSDGGAGQGEISWHISYIAISHRIAQIILIENERQCLFASRFLCIQCNITDLMRSHSMSCMSGASEPHKWDPSNV